MKYKILILFAMLLLCSVVVTAVGQAGTPYSFYNIEKCVGDIKVRVYPLQLNQYKIINCSFVSNNDWVCPCQSNLQILTLPNSTSRISVLVQYYIGEQKKFTPSANGNPTPEEIYNDGLKRIYTIKDIIITSDKKILGKGALSENDRINNILLGTLMIVGGIIFIAFLTIILLWLYDEKLRAWVGLKEGDKMTILMILKRIFTREVISRKEIVRKNGNVLPILKTVEKKIETKVEKKVVDAKEEIRKILEGLDK